MTKMTVILTPTNMIKMNKITNMFLKVSLLAVPDSLVVAVVGVGMWINWTLA